jgi:NAD(P)-binding Rossmann-like domain
MSILHDEFHSITDAELPPARDNDLGYDPITDFDNLICDDECGHYGRRFIKKKILALKPPPFIGKSLFPSARNSVVPVDPQVPIGIIGAGLGGLYAAMILQSLGIPFQILEASPTRTGGHFYTHRFDDKDYFVCMT